jgi:predicted RNase H-like nuclease (RuvC/YqgF family)
MTDDETGSDIEIEIFQKLSLPIRGAINREIEKKRNDKRELRREKDELKRWRNKLGYVVEDLQNIAKDKLAKLQTNKSNFEEYRQIEHERMKNRISESKTDLEIKNIKREIERLDKSLKEQEKRARDNTQPRNKDRPYYEHL